MEKLRFALEYGADAVYAGQPQFSLRARENSFMTPEDIEQAIAYTHSKGKKFFLTSNIIPHNNKIKAFQQSLADYIELKPDALIMSDPGMIHYIRQNFPHQDIHLSVQANCTNWSTAAFWRDLGVKRLILSRELNIREVSLIHQEVPDIELEVFVHGAICMAYSGRCLLSNFMNHRASNQGACSNACRFKYELYAKNEPQSEDYVPLEGEFYLKESENEGGGMMAVDEDPYGTYIMNSKDMCAIEHLDKLRDAGVVSFKIEGRTKSLYYLSQAVRSYRGAIDDLEAGKPWDPQHLENIQKLDSRGYIPGFFIPQRDLPQNYETTRVISETAKVAGVVRSYDPETKKAFISVKGQIFEGDTLELVTPEGSIAFTATGLVNHKKVAVDKISPGMEGCQIDLDKDPGEFGILIKLLNPQEITQNATAQVI
jgi:putative protease